MPLFLINFFSVEIQIQISNINLNRLGPLSENSLPLTLRKGIHIGGPGPGQKSNPGLPYGTAGRRIPIRATPHHLRYRV
jgi:hypothetical protein